MNREHMRRGAFRRVPSALRLAVAVWYGCTCNTAQNRNTRKKPEPWDKGWTPP